MEHDDHAMLSVINNKVDRLDRDVQKLDGRLDTIDKELEARFVLIVRFVPIERGFWWLTSTIVGTVLLAIIYSVLRK